MEKTICELFAGVGGFRLGFDNLKSNWETVWFSQWEPGAKTQWAHDCYVKHFGDCQDTRGEFHTGEDIGTVNKNTIPDHNLLVGGFPCQDYSVAHSLTSSKGIEGKKGVLWWQIRDTIIAKHPPFCLFENVDRLLKSPAKQKGRDFGIILKCLEELGYAVEWRIINAAEYGGAQKRKRVFIFAYSKNTEFFKKISGFDSRDIIERKGFFAHSFAISSISAVKNTRLNESVIDISDRFSFNFENSGYMIDGNIYTAKVEPQKERAKSLCEIVENNVNDKYYITPDKKEKWRYLKEAKKIQRKSKDGHEYVFSEGAIAFPDSLDKPGRTMLTSEGTLNRSSHVILDPETNNLRILTPVEVERLQGFDDGWTDTGMPERMRYFCMGNALVVPMVTKMGEILNEIFEKEPSE